MMNRGISTPLDVAEKISLRKAQSAVLAIVRPKEESLEEGDDFLFSEEYQESPVAVDVNQPLQYSCNLGIILTKSSVTGFRHFELQKRFVSGAGILRRSKQSILENLYISGVGNPTARPFLGVGFSFCWILVGFFQKPNCWVFCWI